MLLAKPQKGVTRKGELGGRKAEIEKDRTIRTKTVSGVGFRRVKSSPDTDDGR